MDFQPTRTRAVICRPAGAFALSGQMNEMYSFNRVYVRNNLKPEAFALSGQMNEMYLCNTVYVGNNLKPEAFALSGQIRVVFSQVCHNVII